MGNETSAVARLSPIHSRHWTPPAAARDAYNIDAPSFGRTLAARLGFHLICITRPCSHLFDGFNIVDAVGGALLLSLLLTAIALVSRRHRRAAAASAGTSLFLLLVLRRLQRMSPCGGCQYMLHLRCPHGIINEGGILAPTKALLRRRVAQNLGAILSMTPFHRLHDCLVPRYAYIRAHQNVTHCVATAPQELGQLIPILLGHRGFRAVDIDAACVERWPRIEPSSYPRRKSCWCVPSGRKAHTRTQYLHRCNATLTDLPSMPMSMYCVCTVCDCTQVARILFV